MFWGRVVIGLGWVIFYFELIVIVGRYGVLIGSFGLLFVGSGVSFGNRYKVWEWGERFF